MTIFSRDTAEQLEGSIVTRVGEDFIVVTKGETDTKIYLSPREIAVLNEPSQV